MCAPGFPHIHSSSAENYPGLGLGVLMAIHTPKIILALALVWPCHPTQPWCDCSPLTKKILSQRHVSCFGRKKILRPGYVWNLGVTHMPQTIKKILRPGHVWKSCVTYLRIFTLLLLCFLTRWSDIMTPALLDSKNNKLIRSHSFASYKHIYSIGFLN